MTSNAAWFALLLVAACGSPRPAPSAPPAPLSPSAEPGAASAAPSAAAVVPEASSASPTSTVAAASSTTPASEPTVHPVPLPGATGPVSLDYIVYEPEHARVWVPAGGTGSVAVLDVASSAFTRVPGFGTAEREGHGKKRMVGPSAASVGDGYVYVGNRATSEVCPIDVKTLAPRPCLKLASSTDGVAYVASAKEVWVTTPHDRSLTILDASKPGALAPKAVVKVPGGPEGYASDDASGLFFTNLEDEGKTLAIDVKTRKIRATWSPGCGSDGPRGLAFDAARRLLVVACTDHVQVLDTAHDGALLGRLDTGAGVDNIDYLAARQLLYVAAGGAARLTVARLDDRGQLAVAWTAKTSDGARNAVAEARGAAYVTDSKEGRILVVSRGGGAP